MKALERIIALILISIFVIGAIFISYTGIKNGAVVYATVDDDSIYVPLRSESDAVKAFQAYCKSRDLTIEGSLTDAVTTFTTGAFNSACNEIGIDITELQAEIKAEYDQSGEPVKFFFNDTGVMAMNRIFAQFLQDNELSVGDSANENDNTVYDGYNFDFGTGNSLVYVVNGVGDNKLVQRGIPLVNSESIYNSIAVGNISSYNFTYNNQDYPYYIGKKAGASSYNDYLSIGKNSNLSDGTVLYQVSKSDSRTSQLGDFCLIYNLDGGTLNLGKVVDWVYLNGNYQRNTWSTLYVLQYSQNDIQQTTVYLTTNNTVINNNNYEGDTIINNEGDIINNPDNPDNPDQPDFPDYPEEPTGNVDDWGAEMPNLDIPWYLQGKEDKFPWNIPFNIMLTLSLLKAEPEAPHFEGTMDFKFTTYDYEIDLSQFDDVAEVLRKMEVIAFLIGLMVLTRNLIGW